MPAKKRVLIVGGGIAGLTVAHELARYDSFDVNLYEQNAEAGGRARSIRLPNNNPSEHSMRGFFQCYCALYQTMKEIPDGNGSVYDNLVYNDIFFKTARNEVRYSSNDQVFPNILWSHLRLYRFFRKEGVPTREFAYFTYKLLRWMWMCPARIYNGMEKISFADYLNHKERTEAFRRTLMHLPDVLTAAKPTAASSRIVEMLLSIMLGSFARTRYNRRGTAVLKGPSNERFLDPWVAHLRAKGVGIHLGRKINDLLVKNDRIDGVVIGGVGTVKADIYVIAVQHNILNALLTQQIRDLAPSLDKLLPLGEEWSCGAQYHLKELPKSWEKNIGRATLRLDAPWSIVYTLQTNRENSWENVPLPPGTEGVLTLAFSNAITPGVKYKKKVKECTSAEILDECLTQIGFDDRKCIASSVIGPDMQHLSYQTYQQNKKDYRGYDVSQVSSNNEVIVNDGPIYIAQPGNADFEPRNATEIDNLFIAGEFTQLYTPVPTMEGANESGKRCAEAICKGCGLDYDAERYKGVQIPLSFLKTLDGYLYRGEKRVGRYTLWLILAVAAALAVYFIAG